MTMKLLGKVLSNNKNKAPPKPEKQCSQMIIDDSSTQEFEGDDCYENGFFHEELSFIRSHSGFTKVTFTDFVDRHERDDLLNLSDVIKNSNCQWRVIRFQDTIEGTNLRRWQFKKESVHRSIHLALIEAGLLNQVSVVFEEQIKVDMDEMSRAAIVHVLQDAEKDHHISSVCLDGFVRSEDIRTIACSLIRLLKVDDRRWKSIAFRCSFDGDDYDEWNSNVTSVRGPLEVIRDKLGLPIEFCVC